MSYRVWQSYEPEKQRERERSLFTDYRPMHGGKTEKRKNMAEGRNARRGRGFSSRFSMRTRRKVAVAETLIDCSTRVILDSQRDSGQRRPCWWRNAEKARKPGRKPRQLSSRNRDVLAGRRGKREGNGDARRKEGSVFRVPYDPGEIRSIRGRIC